jgi:hypothetical protein
LRTLEIYHTRDGLRRSWFDRVLLHVAHEARRLVGSYLEPP